jgi:hypothetical protein
VRQGGLDYRGRSVALLDMQIPSRAVDPRPEGRRRRESLIQDTADAVVEKLAQAVREREAKSLRETEVDAAATRLAGPLKHRKVSRWGAPALLGDVTAATETAATAVARGAARGG